MADLSQIRALAFDVFGTTVDWCAGIAREAEAMLAPKGYALDWVKFANHWRREYQPAMDKVRTGARGYVVMDVLHREMLEAPLKEFGVDGLSEAEKHVLTEAWRKLDPWPDVVSAMQRMKKHVTLVACSNANIALATAMAKRSGLPWDLILGSEFVKTYKPMAPVYDSVGEALQLKPHQVMMVACHVWDLDAAKARGLSTAFIARPNEYGPGRGGPPPKTDAYDIIARDFDGLADALGV